MANHVYSRPTNLIFRVLIATFIALFSTVSFAQDDKEFDRKDTGFGIGYALVRFDTSFKFTDKQTDQSLFVDAEGTFNLPDYDAIPVLYGTYRFSPNHAIGFSYFRVSRQSSIINIDETFDDVHIIGEATFNDDTQFLNISYANTLHEDDRSRILGLFGLTVLDVRYVFDAEGTITYDNMTTVGTLREDTGVLAPMPQLGLDFWYAFTPKWGISTRVSLVAGSFDDIRGFVISSNINAKYRFSESVGAIFGISYFDADFIIEDSLERTDVEYSYDGVFVGLHALF